MTASDPPRSVQPGGEEGECFRTLHESSFERLLAAIAIGCEGLVQWPARVVAALAAALEFLAAEPRAARALTLDALSGGSAAWAVHRAAVERLASMLSEGRGYYARAALSPAAAERVVVEGILAELAERVAAGEAQRLPSLLAPLSELALLPCLSGEDAKRAVRDELQRRESVGADPFERLRGMRLPAEQVAASQRRRLCTAIAEQFLERGYAHTTVLEISQRAGVSKQSFYQRFADRRQCLLAAYAAAEEQLAARIAEAAASRPDWPTRVHAALGATLRFFVSEPHAFYLLTIEGPAADPALAARHLEASARLGALLRAGREQGPEAASLPAATEAALIAYVATSIRACLLDGEAAGLAQLEPSLAEFVLTPYLGSAEARRIATANAG